MRPLARFWETSFALDDDPARLPVSDAAAHASSLPPAIGPPSAEQERFCEEVYGALQLFFAPGAAPGTARTYEATIRGIAPKVTAKLSSCVLPMESEGAFYAFFTAALLQGPKSLSSATRQPAVRWSYVKLVKAAVAFWHVVRGKRAIFDTEWFPRMGALRAGIKCSYVRATSEKSPLSPADKPAVRIRGNLIWPVCGRE